MTRMTKDEQLAREARLEAEIDRAISPELLRRPDDDVAPLDTLHDSATVVVNCLAFKLAEIIAIFLPRADHGAILRRLQRTIAAAVTVKAASLDEILDEEAAA